MQLCNIPQSYKAADPKSNKFMEIMNIFIFIRNITKVNKELIGTKV